MLPHHWAEIALLPPKIGWHTSQCEKENGTKKTEMKDGNLIKKSNT